MNKPQPIDTAPTDGTVILTDAGIVCAWTNPNWDKVEWMRCTPQGDELSPADYDSPLHMFDATPYNPQPTLWVPLPDWINEQ